MVENPSRVREVEGKEALPTSSTPSTNCCQQFVHQGSLGLHQPLTPVVVHGFTAMCGLSQETPTTSQADVSQLPQERDPLERLLYDPVSRTGLEGGVLGPKVPMARVKTTGTIPKQPREKKESVEVFSIF